MERQHITQYVMLYMPQGMTRLRAMLHGNRQLQTPMQMKLLKGCLAMHVRIETDAAAAPGGYKEHHSDNVHDLW